MGCLYGTAEAILQNLFMIATFLLPLGDRSDLVVSDPKSHISGNG